jgi:hypothetical protein
MAKMTLEEAMLERDQCVQTLQSLGEQMNVLNEGAAQTNQRLVYLNGVVDGLSPEPAPPNREERRRAAKGCATLEVVPDEGATDGAAVATKRTTPRKRAAVRS